MSFEKGLADLQETYNLLLEALHDMNAKLVSLKRENEKLISEVDRLEGELENE
jgi:phage shock protein A|tara:strand:+ start:24652 stop:24810 length:159 start_codon:yes stop_codon:yes gene_type:complete